MASKLNDVKLKNEKLRLNVRRKEEALKVIT